MIPDDPVPLTDDAPGCVLETKPRNIQNGTNPPIYYVILNREWLSQLGILEQGAPTVHSLATRPVTLEKPAIVIQPAELVR